MILRSANSLLKKFGFAVVRTTPPHSAANVTRSAAPLRLNIGSGGWTHPEWHTLDMPSESYAKAQAETIDFPHDLMSNCPLPIEDNSLVAIYCSHVVEHLTNEVVDRLFQEAFRVLAPGGYLRITCPDMQLITDAYQAQREDFFKRFAFNRTYHPASLHQAYLHCFAAVLTTHHPYSSVEKVTDDELIQLLMTHRWQDVCDQLTARIPLESQQEFPECHRNWFTEQKLIDMLKSAGFSRVFASRYAQSKSPDMIDPKYFDQTHPWMSLYVEAEK